MIEIIPIVLGDDFVPYGGPLRVDIEFYCKHPKKTKLSAPRADIDNYIKAALDALNTHLWDDDTQIQQIYATKQWAEPGAEGYFTIGVDQL